MIAGVRADVISPHARCRLTWQGWCVLALSVPLGATLLMPGWHPQAYPAALALGLLLALGLTRWMAPRLLHGITGEWILPRSAYAMTITPVGCRLSAAHNVPPLSLLAWQSMERKFEVVARLAGLEAQTSRMQLTWVSSFPRRGLQRLSPLSVMSNQPFG